MNAREMLRVALRGIGSNRARSFLTVLGILIGVASVIVLVAVGNGSAIAVARRFDALGTNTLTVQGGGFGRGARQNAATSLTMKDVTALRRAEYREYIAEVVPVLNVQSVSATFQEASTTPGRFLGTEPQLADAGNWKVQSGRFFDAVDLSDRARVLVVGSTVATNLFGTEQPVGQVVKLNGTLFEVIGVLESKGTNGVQDQDDVAFAPLTTVRDTISGGSTLNQVIVQARARAVSAQAQTVINDVLTGLHPSSNGQQNFLVLNQASLLQSSADTSRTLTVLLAAVAAISLLVGGIGIMNIMLVTVTERTREIGIRKAVGAPKRAILGQFLFEAGVLGAIGGIGGVLTGILGSRFRIAGTVPVLRVDSVVLALLVAVAISLFFGFYPANRAATMRPIDALRHE